MVQDVYLVEVDGFDVDDAAVITHRWADGEGFDPLDDTIPAYENRVIDPGNFEQFLYRRGTTIGKSSSGAGDILINNNDGGIDDIVDRGFDGRAVTVRRGASTLDNPSDFTTVFTGTIEQVEFQEDEIRFKLKNRQGEVAGLSIVSETERFTGVESPSTHVNGDENIKGKPFPWLLGNGGGENFSPPLVNNSLQTYQISYREINSITTVFSEGATVTPGTAHATLALLQAATVTGGEFDSYLGSGSDGAYFRIGGAIGGAITCKAVHGAAASNRTMAQICEDVMVRAGDNFDATSITDLDTANSDECGIWLGTEENKVGNILDRILQSDNGFWFDSIAGIFILGRLEAVSGSADLTLEEADLIGAEKITFLDFNDQGRGIPPSQIIYSYNRNYTIQSEGDLAGVALGRTEFVKKRWRTVQSDAAAAVLTKHLLAAPFEVEGLFPATADAQTAADRFKTLRGVTRDLVMVVVDEPETQGLNLNDIVTINFSRYSDSGSEDYRVLGKINEFSTNKVTLFLWK